ncbi:MAG: DUF1501 domain-containing protein [Verrucomicrobiales bacterium]
MSLSHVNTDISRRYFLGECGIGLGKIAAAGLLTDSLGAAPSASDPLAPKFPHHQPRAKAVIHLFMAGAPSQLELFDPKPKLTELQGNPLPKSIIGDQRYAFIQPDAAVMGPQFEFTRHGQSGAVLGSTQNLPAFVVMNTGGGVSGGTSLWSSGFLPTTYTGVRFRNGRDPILNVSTPQGFSDELQRDTFKLINKLNAERLEQIHDEEIATRMASFEMAARLQTSAPELMDLSSESKATLDSYGCDPDKPSFARACLLARRMVERGVRLINIYHSGWDAHSNVKGSTISKCQETDQASAALIMDLKRQGLLDETLVIWGGEFGRTPMVETNPSLGRNAGRDHHPQAYTMWMAGGGVRPGLTYGATDEFGFNITENPVHVHDLQATILHLLGFDHERLTFHHAGRDFRLTDVHGHVVHDLLA